MELFVMQWAIIAPVAVAALVLRVLLQALLAAVPARSVSNGTDDPGTSS